MCEILFQKAWIYYFYNFQFQVWREFSQKTDNYVTSKLRIYHMQNKRYRSLWYIHYSDWNEQNIPTSVGPFLCKIWKCFLLKFDINLLIFSAFLEELSSVRMASVNEIPPGHNTNPPVLIHCSGGGGRAGVTLAADLLLFTLDHNQVSWYENKGFSFKKSNWNWYDSGVPI